MPPPAWLRLQQLPDGPEMELLNDAAALPLSASCTVPAEDQQLMLPARPASSRDAACYLLPRGCGAELGQRTDQLLPSSGPTAWPRVPPGAGPVGMFLHAWALIAVVPDLREVQRRRGVPDAVVRDTLAGLGTMMAAQAAKTDIHGVGPFPLWCPPHRVCGTNGTTGQHDVTRIETGSSDGTAGYALQVHVPPTGRLIDAGSPGSLARGLAFFTEPYPDESTSALVCRCWFPSPSRAEYLPADSSLVSVQLLPATPTDDGRGGDRPMMSLGLHLPAPAEGALTEEDLQRVPSSTTLQRAFVTHLRSARHWRARTGTQWLAA